MVKTYHFDLALLQNYKNLDPVHTKRATLQRSSIKGGPPAVVHLSIIITREKEMQKQSIKITHEMGGFVENNQSSKFHQRRNRIERTHTSGMIDPA